uniref:KHDC4/BBP-like KH-domain type I domain-containing protein n=1 Tax=Zea mays TaxID=4577 RepID=C4J1K4_MAIZE|nr:unknown [Zea mays]
MKETGVTVVLRGKDSENLGSCHSEASQQPLHLYLTSMHLKNLEAAKVLAENLLDTVAAEFGASRISSSKVYGAVPPPQQLLAGVDTSGTKSDVHYIVGPNVLSGATHSFASTGVIAPVVAPAVTVQSGAPTYSGVPLPSNMAYPIPPANGGAFYSGYGGHLSPSNSVAAAGIHTQACLIVGNSGCSSDVHTNKHGYKGELNLGCGDG